MKTLRFFLMMLFVSVAAAGMVSCGDDDNGQKPDFTADYPELDPIPGKVTIVAKFTVAPCEGNSVYFAGTYNEWDTSDPATMAKFEPVGTVDGKEWPGWYKVTVDTASTDKDGTPYLLAGKPVQVVAGSEFDWAYQIGYESEADVEKKAGDIDLYPGFTKEVDVFYNSTFCALVFHKWKESPCVAVPTHSYTFSVTVPATTPDTSKVRIVGGFAHAELPDWSVTAPEMELTKGENGKYSITLNNVKEGTGYKYVINGDWQGWDGEELAPSDSTCAAGIDNRALGTATTVNDVVANWRDVTLPKCD
ncbi:MAG: hypothetical protein LBK47_10880 [Prevotellaceae bacterium]|jgi:hypothetical protein|nr:hypothetical protein [Prevotellaceae bacterium]